MHGSLVNNNPTLRAEPEDKGGYCKPYKFQTNMHIVLYSPI